MTVNCKFPADTSHTQLPSPGSICPRIPSYPSSHPSQPQAWQRGKGWVISASSPPSPHGNLPPTGSQTDSLAAPSRGPVAQPWASSIIHSLPSAPQTKGRGECRSQKPQEPRAAKALTKGAARRVRWGEREGREERRARGRRGAGKRRRWREQRKQNESDLE